MLKNDHELHRTKIRCSSDQISCFDVELMPIIGGEFFDLCDPFNLFDFSAFEDRTADPRAMLLHDDRIWDGRFSVYKDINRFFVGIKVAMFLHEKRNSCPCEPG